METYIKATPPFIGNWVRPADWLAMPTVVSTDDTFVGLYAIFPSGNNFAAFSFTTSAGQYQVDWGDGNVTLHNSNTTAEYVYDYSTYDTGNVTLTSRGYKQAIIRVTAVSGLLRTCNFNVRYTGQNITYATGFLDCIISMPNANSGNSIVFGGSPANIRHSYCERVDVKTIGACTSTLFMFMFCYSLQSVSLFNTVNVTNTSYMFGNCLSLQSVPLFNTSNVSNMEAMFLACRSLQSLPLLNTANVTNMQQMFEGCSFLKTTPLFNTSNVTTMNGMFNGCSTLKTVPLFTTNNVNNMGGMFLSCISLQTVPLFNTSNVTTMNDMFRACTSLQSIPFFTTNNVTNMSNMFNGCSTLETVPALSTAAITISSGTDFTNFLISCNNLNRCPMIFARSVNLGSCQLSRTSLEEIFTNLVSRTGASATITVSGNYGVGTIVSRTFTTTDGSTTITTADTSSLVAGMQVTGTGSPLTSPVAVTFQDAGDTVTLLGHGLENGDEVSFATVVSTTGIALNTIYYIINKTTDTFQLATSVGGSAIPLTTDGSGTMRHRTEIVSIVPNTSITMSRPMRGTGAQTLAFRLLRTGTALLKNWAVTG
jgi:surface protein